MAGYAPQKLARTQAAPSGFSISTQFSRGGPGISFLQTEPVQGNNRGSIWNSGEEQQYLNQESLPQGISHHGFSDSFNSFPASQMIQSGQTNVRGSISNAPRNQWTDLSSVNGEAMSRMPSQDSTGAHSHRTASTANSYDQARSAAMYPSISQMSFHNSSARSDVTGRSISPDNSALYTPTQQADLQTFEHLTYPGGENFSRSHSVFHRGSITDLASNASLTSAPPYNFHAASSNEPFALTVSQDAVIFSSHTVDNSPMWNSTAFPDSQRSSPTLEDWPLPPPQMSSGPNSPLDGSSTLEGVSPKGFPDFVELPPYPTSDRIVRKPMGPRPSKVASDYNRQQRLNGTSETSEESLRFVGRSSLEIDNTARDHALYQNVTVQADGLYHCPWEGKEGCQHKAEKLKCNYDKFVDSHLKPYRCKVFECQNSRFSSTACLLRHEREAHAMHGHGDKPYLCTYEGCERGASGNGFPRHWNLRDHMRRVHNDPGPTKSNASGSPPPSTGPVRGKNKRKAESPDAASMEKVVKRVATPDVITRQEPSLVEHYHQSKIRLMDVVKQLEDPRNANNMDMLRNASDCIKVMAQTTQRINSAPQMGRTFSQQSG